MTPISTYLADTLYWGFIIILLINMTQRKYQDRVHKKRLATLLLGISVFLMFLVAQSIETYSGSDWMLIPGFGLILVVLYVYREHTWPFTIRCPQDGKKLTFHEILYDDDPCTTRDESPIEMAPDGDDSGKDE